MEDVIRPATADEKREMVELTGRHKDVFLDALAKEQQKYGKEHKPFCSRCAKIDFKDKVENIIKEKSRQLGAELTQDDINKVEQNIKTNYAEYADAKRFELIEEAEITERKFIDGAWIPYVTGYYMNFRCKNRGCGIAVEVPIREYNAMKGKTNNKI